MPTGTLHLVKDSGGGYAIGRCCMERGYSNEFDILIHSNDYSDKVVVTYTAP